MTDQQQAPQKMMDKIKALLAKAENPAATEEEAASYQAKAFELMAKYGIEMAMIADAKAATAAEKPLSRTFECPNPWGEANRQLVTSIAYALGCQVVWSGNRRGALKTARVYGFESDLERVSILYASLRLQMHRGMSAADVPFGESSRAYRRSWLLGFVHKIHTRLENSEQAATEQAETSSTGRSAAVVLADRRTIVKRLYQEENPKLGKGRRITTSGTGFTSGSAAGARADIGNRARLTG